MKNTLCNGVELAAGAANCHQIMGRLHTGTTLGNGHEGTNSASVIAAGPRPPNFPTPPAPTSNSSRVSAPHGQPKGCGCSAETRRGTYVESITLRKQLSSSFCLSWAAERLSMLGMTGVGIFVAIGGPKAHVPELYGAPAHC